MRRKVTLYIGGRKADLADTSFLLMNYTAEDLSNPTIVKNSFSQQVTLPGTCRNNRIFGAMWRSDRVSGAGGSTGAAFNASKRTSFALYGEDGAVLESGYLKLDEVAKTGRFSREYKVTLYGGLGGFFYSLSYNEDGTKKSLADLTFVTGNFFDSGEVMSDEEFEFDINKEYVGLAWEAIRNDFQQSNRIHGVVNFAPAYEGIPKEFEADKAIVSASAPLGTPTSITVDGVQYGAKSGYVLVNLDGQKDEWAVKDLRSYLQRPVVRVKTIISSCAYPGNNGGYAFEAGQTLYDTLENVWLTRPLLPTLGTMKETTSGSATVTWTPGTGSGATGVATIGGNTPAGTRETVRLRLNYTAVASSSEETLAGSHSREDRGSAAIVTHGWNTIVFLQAVAYNQQEDTVLGTSKVTVISDPICGLYFGAQSLADLCGYTPQGGADYNAVYEGEWNRTAANNYTFSKPIALDVEGYDIAKVRVIASVYRLQTTRANRGDDIRVSAVISSSNPVLYEVETFSPVFVGATGTTATEASASTVAIALEGGIRTGAHITKRILLSTSYTPADLLLAIAKMFGLVFIYDKAERKVSLVGRDEFYQNETIDLTKRVDASQEVKIVPMAFSARWYDFKQEVIEGGFAAEYKKNYGRDYGMQRVNTGYDFDANAVDLLAGSCIKSCAAIKDFGAYWDWIADGSNNFRPSVYMDPSVTVTLWAADGSTTEVPVPQPDTSFTLHYYNSDFPGYDSMARAEFRNEENAPVEGTDTLLYLEGAPLMEHFKLTDDFSEMFAMTGGKPCWSLEMAPYQGPQYGYGSYVPNFSRYEILTAGMTQSLDFGVPSEMAIPGITYDPDATVYARMWRKYIADRYDTDTKVMTCKVDLSGLQVGQDLLRKFYWYDGALWVLNKIVNHSLTTYGPTECEFVQVRDKNNYLNGQE